MEHCVMLAFSVLLKGRNWEKQDAVNLHVSLPWPEQKTAIDLIDVYDHYVTENKKYVTII